MSTDSILSISVDTDRFIITTAELARQIGVDGDQSLPLIDTAKAASAMIEDYCRTQFLQRTYIETWHDRPPWVRSPYDVRLKRAPVSSIVEVLDANAAVVPVSDYELIDPEIGKLRFFESDAFGLSVDRWKLTITYIAGFSKIPDDLKRATLEVGQKLYRSTATTDADVQSESLGDWSATYGRSFISGAVRGVLDNYRVLNLW